MSCMCLLIGYWCIRCVVRDDLFVLLLLLMSMIGLVVVSVWMLCVISVVVCLRVVVIGLLFFEGMDDVGDCVFGDLYEWYGYDEQCDDVWFEVQFFFMVDVYVDWY